MRNLATVFFIIFGGSGLLIAYWTFGLDEHIPPAQLKIWMGYIPLAFVFFFKGILFVSKTVIDHKNKVLIRIEKIFEAVAPFMISLVFIYIFFFGIIFHFKFR